MNGKLFDRRHHIAQELAVDIRLFSAGPKSVAATEVIRILLQGGNDLLLPYVGGGKYEIRSGDTSRTAQD